MELRLPRKVVSQPFHPISAKMRDDESLRLNWSRLVQSSLISRLSTTLGKLTAVPARPLAEDLSNRRGGFEFEPPR